MPMTRIRRASRPSVRSSLSGSSLIAVILGSGGGGGAGMSGIDSLALPMPATTMIRPIIAIHRFIIISPRPAQAGLRKRSLLRLLQRHGSKRLDQCPLLRVEQSNHAIESAGADLFAIGREGDGENGAFVAGERGDALAILGVN